MPSRPNRILALVVGVIAVIGVVAGVLASTREAPEYDRGTPVGVVQAYLTAVIDGDHQSALDLVAGSTCTVEHLEQSYFPQGVRVVLRDSDIDGDTARVRVDIAMPSGAPLSGSEYVEEHTFRLSRESGDWLITSSPWPMYDCDWKWEE